MVAVSEVIVTRLNAMWRQSSTEPPSTPQTCSVRVHIAGGLKEGMPRGIPPLSSAAVLPSETASPAGGSPPSGDYSPRICPAVSSHSNSDVTPLKNRRKVSLTKRRMFLPRALVMRVSVR